MPEPPAQGRIPELDGLRGAAILFVLAYHYINGVPGGQFGSPLAYFQRIFALGWTGVDLFFVLSGFLIGGILLDARSSPRYFKPFYARRFFRNIPIYYAWILCYLLLVTTVGFALPAYVGAIPESRLPVYTYLLFLVNMKSVHYSLLAAAWFVPLWSLSVEEQFYIISPIFVRSLSTRALSVVLCGLVLATPLLRVLVRKYTESGFEWAYALMPCRADALAIGILAAVFWRNVRFRSHVAAHSNVLHGLLCVFLVGALIFWRFFPSPYALVMQSAGYTWIALLYGLILLLALLNPAGPIAWLARMRWLRELGGVSYCIYIVHQVVNLFCHALLLHATPDISNWKSAAVTLLAGGVAYGVAKISWRFFESPLIRRGHAFRY